MRFEDWYMKYFFGHIDRSAARCAWNDLVREIADYVDCGSSRAGSNCDCDPKDWPEDSGCHHTIKTDEATMVRDSFLETIKR